MGGRGAFQDNPKDRHRLALFDAVEDAVHTHAELPGRVGQPIDRFSVVPLEQLR